MKLQNLIIIICLLLISACGFSEKEARVLLNQAISEWDSGEIENSLVLFDRISNEYIDTKAATEALKEKAQRLEEYRQEYNPEKNLAQNKGLFSKLVILSVDKYYKKHDVYPESLSEITISLQKSGSYISSCIYKKALLNYGYQLNCIEANSAYLADREKTENEARRLLNTAINLWTKGHKKESMATFTQISEQYHSTRVASKAQSKKEFFLGQLKQKGNNLTKIYFIDDFPKANITWGQTLNPSGKIPSSGFSAYYINTSKPSSIISTQDVKKISVDYAYDELHGIRSQDFGAYWVGDIYLTTNEIKRIKFKQSWSKTRLIIDGHIIYEGGDDRDFLLNFKSGAHRVEVEYINNWHTTEFSMSFIDFVQQYLSNSEIKSLLHENVIGQYTPYFVGVYESSSSNRPITLQINKTSEPIVLFLSSYENIRWNISNPFKVDIRAIVYGSTNRGSSITGEIEDSILLPNKDAMGSYSTEQRCSCDGGSYFHCSGENILSTKKIIESLSNFQLTGFTGKYSAKSLQVPEIKIDDLYIIEAKKKAMDIEKIRQSCLRKKHPDFENIMEDIDYTADFDPARESKDLIMYPGAIQGGPFPTRQQKINGHAK